MSLHEVPLQTCPENSNFSFASEAAKEDMLSFEAASRQCNVHNPLLAASTSLEEEALCPTNIPGRSSALPYQLIHSLTLSRLSVSICNAAWRCRCPRRWCTASRNERSCFHQIQIKEHHLKQNQKSKFEHNRTLTKQQGRASVIFSSFESNQTRIRFNLSSHVLFSHALKTRVSKMGQKSSFQNMLGREPTTFRTSVESGIALCPQNHESDRNM